MVQRWPDLPGGQPGQCALIVDVQRAAAEETNWPRRANRALPAWRNSPPRNAAILKRWSELMLSNQKDLAQLLTWNKASPGRSHGQGSTPRASSSGSAKKQARLWRRDPEHKADARIIGQEASGVVAAITVELPPPGPPRLPGVAAGCTMILKPSKETPLSRLPWRCWPNRRDSAACQLVSAMPWRLAAHCSLHAGAQAVVHRFHPHRQAC